MNIQIFGSKKDNDTKKAQRFFKERGIRFQYIDLREKTLSKGEFRSVAAVNGGLEGMINKECNDRDALALVTYIAEEDKLDKILENPQILKIPIINAILAISIITLMPLKSAKDIAIFVMVLAMAFLSNVVNMVAVGAKKESIR